MTTTRSLDDLDRFAFRLGRLVKQQYPQLMTQGFTLIDLEERLLPYRDTRREMADSSPMAWEHTMLRLIAGERGILTCEEPLRGACVQALTMASPTLGMVRMWSTSVLTLNASELATEAPRPVGRAHADNGCRFCGGRLPDGRALTFCPHCGLDLTKRQCAACSTELEANWRFCVTCGRGADAQTDAYAEAYAAGAPPLLEAQVGRAA